MMTFHLLRPWWLLALIPAALLVWQLLKRHNTTSSWAKVIDSELLTALLDNTLQQRRSWQHYLLLAAWSMAAIGMAGPSFEKHDQTALKQADALVILLDLSPSMLAQDVQPSRLQAAHYKILDLLRERKEGYTGLVAYSGSAHVVAPLSDDTNTIAALVNTLEPRIMPSIGSQTEDAVSEALQLLSQSHFTRGRLLLLTDGVAPAAVQSITQQLKGKPVELFVIGIGTAEGAPIPLQDGGFLQDNNGKILNNQLDTSTLQQLAQDNGGEYSPLRSNDSDIAPLIAPPSWLADLGNGNQRDASHTIENWQDSGYWLVMPCLLIALLYFRRGALVCLLPLLLMLNPETTRAEVPQTWQDWWQTPDQQAAKALEKNDAASAAKLFTDPQWKAYAEYQNGQHKEAAEHFSSSDSAAAHYNQGNALAHANDLQGALAAYETALAQQKDFPDATFNRDLVKKLLEEQESQPDNQKQEQQQKQDEQNQEQQKNEQQQNQDQNQQQNEQQQNQNQQQQQQQNQSQQQSDQQKSDQQNEQSEQQQKEQQQKEQQQKEQQQKQDQQSGQQASEQEKPANEKPAEQANEEKVKEDEKQKDSEKNVQSDDGKSRADMEKQQATEQWLRKVPDDPGGLLKNKFEYYYQLNQQEEIRKRRAGIETTEEQRW